MSDELNEKDQELMADVADRMLELDSQSLQGVFEMQGDDGKQYYTAVVICIQVCDTIEEAQKLVGLTDADIIVPANVTIQ